MVFWAMAGNEWRSVRVYVSSVFDDAVGERHHLADVVRAGAASSGRHSAR